MHIELTAADSGTLQLNQTIEVEVVVGVQFVYNTLAFITLRHHIVSFARVARREAHVYSTSWKS